MGFRRVLFGVAVAWPLATLAQEVRFDAPQADDALQDALRGASLTLGLSPEDTPAPEDYIAAARADYRRLLTALYADGYYSGTISIRVDGREAAGLAPFDAPARIGTIAIAVDPGPRFAFGRAEIAPLAPATVLPETFRSGEPAESAVIRESVDVAVTAWRDIGYAKVAPGARQITARHADQILNVDVAIVTGPQLTFGPTSVSGNEDVRGGRISRIAGIETGAVYSPAAIAEAEARLRRTGAFDSVALVEADEIGPGNTLPITVQVAEAKPRRFGFGLEVSTLDGLTVSSFWMHRNYLGGAERFRVDGEISGIGGETGGTDYTLGASFRRPAVFASNIDLLANTTLSRLDEPSYLLDQFNTEILFTRPLGDDTTVQAGIGLLAAREETDTGTRDYVLLTFPLGAELDRRDDATNPKAGYYIDLDATPFLSLQGGDNGARMFADARAYRSFGADDRFTLAARSQLGSVMGASLDTAPADYLFYSGGGGTVRGQQYQSLGIDRVIDGQDVRTGGLSFAGAQFEARVDITGSIGVVGFYDVGFVGQDSNPFGDGDWQSGAGIGVRYNTGIGPIRLDIATPASGDNAGERVEVYIGIGQSF